MRLLPLILLLTSLFPQSAFSGYRLSVEDEPDYSFPVTYTGKKPDVIDFVNAILSREEYGEMLGEMAESWEAYLYGQSLPKDRFFYADPKRGFLSYNATFPAKDDYPFSFATTIEYKVMKCSGRGQTLIVENCVQYQDNKPIQGQFSGLTFYLYDARTGRMEQAYGCDLGADSYVPEGTHVAIHSLHRKRNIILCKCHMESGSVCLRLIWNGKTFRIK